MDALICFENVLVYSFSICFRLMLVEGITNCPTEGNRDCPATVLVLVRGRLSRLVRFCLFLLCRGRRRLRAAFLSFFGQVEIVARVDRFAVRRNCLCRIIWCDVEPVWSCYVSCVAWAVGGGRSNGCWGGLYYI